MPMYMVESLDAILTFILAKLKVMKTSAEFNVIYCWMLFYIIFAIHIYKVSFYDLVFNDIKAIFIQLFKKSIVMKNELGKMQSS